MSDTSLITNKKRVIAATGQTYMDTVISSFPEFEAVEIVDYKEKLFDACKKHMPDILVVTDSIGGKVPIMKTLLDIRVNFSSIRIIYFTGKIDFTDQVRLSNLNLLIASGIYDLIDEDKIEIDLIHFILKSPRTRDQVDFIEAKNVESIYGKKSIKEIEVTYRQNLDAIDSSIYSNLITFISPKGGTGKSFLISNIATAIANMGLPNVNGNKPRIALIDLDFVGFNLSNNFDTLDDNKNVLEAIRQASRIITPNGLVDKKALQSEVVDNIKKMLLPSKKYSNIKILGGPKKKFDESDYIDITHNEIVFIIETILDEYDIIIVDANSDIEYSKIFPLFSMSKDIYSIITMDFNCFFNNNRIEKHTNDFLSSQKIKYILNKDIKGKTVLNSNDFDEVLSYDFVAKIPYINPENIFNTQYNKDFIINQKDNDLLETRYELIKSANSIWPIKNYEKLALKMDAIFNKKEEVVEKKEYSNKYLGFILKSIGLEKEDEDVIANVVKESKITKSLKNFNFKNKVDNLRKGLKEISKDTKESIEESNEDVSEDDSVEQNEQNKENGEE